MIETKQKMLIAGTVLMMDYEQFKAEYEKRALRLMNQNPKTVGLGICAEELAALTDAYPAFEARYDSEN